MHWKDARAAGESEERLYMLGAWRESPLYSERERAALELCEAMTLIADGSARRRLGACTRPPSTSTSSSQVVYRDRGDQHLEPAEDHHAG